MKIGLTGTMSCGKSTLVKELAKLPQFKDYEIATERSVYLRDLGIKLNTDSTLPGQIIFAAERTSELLKDNIITDRSLYDVCAFTWSAQSLKDITKQKYTDLIMEMRHLYDVIIYVSPEGIPIEDNGVRTTDPAYRDRIDAAIRALLDEYPPLKVIEVKGSIDNRIQTILANLS